MAAHEGSRKSKMQQEKTAQPSIIKANENVKGSAKDRNSPSMVRAIPSGASKEHPQCRAKV
jgi:hypothetical protein